MKPDHQYLVADPEVVGQEGAKNLILRFQTVEDHQGKYQRSGKYIHLELTTAYAMRLLVALDGARQHLGLTLTGIQPTRVDVPPDSERH